MNPVLKLKFCLHKLFSHAVSDRVLQVILNLPLDDGSFHSQWKTDIWGEYLIAYANIKMKIEIRTSIYTNNFVFLFFKFYTSKFSSYSTSRRMKPISQILQGSSRKNTGSR